jgi:hypothetical protein
MAETFWFESLYGQVISPLHNEYRGEATGSADNLSFPSSVEAKNVRSYTSLSHTYTSVWLR